MGPLVLVPVEIGAAGAEAVFLQHGSTEAVVTLASPSGVVLAAAAVEGGDDGGEGSDDTGGPTTSQWANALVASFIVSACRYCGRIVLLERDGTSKRTPCRAEARKSSQAFNDDPRVSPNLSRSPVSRGCW